MLILCVVKTWLWKMGTINNYNHFGLINAYFTKFCLPNLFMEWTLQYIFSCNYYKYVLLDYGLSVSLGHIN